MPRVLFFAILMVSTFSGLLADDISDIRLEAEQRIYEHVQEKFGARLTSMFVDKGLSEPDAELVVNDLIFGISRCSVFSLEQSLAKTSRTLADIPTDQGALPVSAFFADQDEFFELVMPCIQSILSESGLAL
jgi:hypothetical protein